MRSDLEQYLVSVPEEFLGHINAKIHALGGYILDMVNKDSHIEVRVGMPDGSMNDFAEWLVKKPHFQASFVQHKS
jgi:acylphosphatase